VYKTGTKAAGMQVTDISERFQNISSTTALTSKPSIAKQEPESLINVPKLINRQIYPWLHWQNFMLLTTSIKM